MEDEQILRNGQNLLNEVNIPNLPPFAYPYSP